VEYFFAALGGGLFGIIVGYVKYLLLWSPVVNGKVQLTQKSIYTRLIIQSFINIATLLTVYLVRNIWPFSFVVTIFATAIALSLMSKFTSSRQKAAIDGKTESNK